MKFWTILLFVVVIGMEFTTPRYYLARRFRAWWQYGRR